MPMFERVNKKTICEQVIDQIKNSITAGDLTPGEKLPSERALADFFSVSRATVREALRALQYMGILEIRMNDGAYLMQDINLLSDQVKTSYLLKQFTLMELLEARKFLEVAIVSLAAERASPEQIRYLEKIYNEEVKHQGDRKKFIKADVTFHMALADACQNSFFRKMIEPVRELLEESNEGQYEKIRQIEITLDYHRRILEAVKNGDPEKASGIMGKHLENIVRTTSEVYRNKLARER